MYYNQTSPKYEVQQSPLGKGWIWNLPIIRTKDGKQYVHLGDGTSYEVEGKKLKGYDWEGISLTTDISLA